MMIQTKSFLIFQVVMAIVTILLMTIYWIIFCYATEELLSLVDSIILSTFFAFAFAIILFPVWKLWKGKKWYSLFLLFFSTITIIAILSFVISILYTSECGFVLYWGVIILYVFAFPANLIISCLIGLIDKYILTKYNRVTS